MSWEAIFLPFKLRARTRYKKLLLLNLSLQGLDNAVDEVNDELWFESLNLTTRSLDAITIAIYNNLPDAVNVYLALQYLNGLLIGWIFVLLRLMVKPIARTCNLSRPSFFCNAD